jgi:3-oxoacyl-[acyl-carrier protein] reductase
MNQTAPLFSKVAVVTGASRGIGRAIALDLAAHGATVAVNWLAQGEAAADVVAAITASGGQALAVQADVSDPEEANRLIEATLAAFGQIDILVNNAGTTRDTLLARMSADQWDTVIDTNLKSVFNCCRAAIRPMLRRKQGGRIINISSVSGLAGVAGQANYAAAKAGIHGFTKALAREVGSRQITVNAVAPGLVPTDLTADLGADRFEAVRQMVPLGRLGTPEDVAHLVTFLASDRAAWITGAIIPVDGGLTA